MLDRINNSPVLSSENWCFSVGLHHGGRETAAILGTGLRPDKPGVNRRGGDRRQMTLVVQLLCQQAQIRQLTAELLYTP